LRTVLFAGEVFPIRHLRRLVEFWPHPDYYNLHGPTDTNVYTFARIPVPIPAEHREPFPIGPAGAHCETVVLGDDNRPVKPGRRGRLAVRRASAFRDYWSLPGRPDRPAGAHLTRRRVSQFRSAPPCVNPDRNRHTLMMLFKPRRARSTPPLARLKISIAVTSLRRSPVFLGPSRVYIPVQYIPRASGVTE
jgi:hypothetical protein